MKKVIEIKNRADLGELLTKILSRLDQVESEVVSLTATTMELDRELDSLYDSIFPIDDESRMDS